MFTDGKKVSSHIMNERVNRMAVIGATVGFGSEILRERYNPKKESWSCFMDSGAMMIWSKDREKLVTGFVPTKEQVMWVYGRELNRAIQKIVEQAQKKYQKGLAKA